MKYLSFLVFDKIINYFLLVIKLIIYSAVFSIPFVFITKLLTKTYKKHAKKRNFIVSCFLTVFPIMYILLLITYFLPSIVYGFEEHFSVIIQAILFNIFKLFIVAIIFTLMTIILIFIASAFYDYYKKKYITKKKITKKQYNLLLLGSITSTNIILFIIYLLFPRLLSLIVYLIYL
jgi:hypothetical protein